MSDRDEFETWIALGIKRNWISKPYCQTHDANISPTERLWPGTCVATVQVLALENVQ